MTYECMFFEHRIPLIRNGTKTSTIRWGEPRAELGDDIVFMADHGGDRREYGKARIKRINRIRMIFRTSGDFDVWCRMTSGGSWYSLGDEKVAELIKREGFASRDDFVEFFRYYYKNRKDRADESIFEGTQYQWHAPETYPAKIHKWDGES